MQTRYVDVDGIRTRYLDVGSGPPLVLVHGGIFGSYWNADDWEHNVPALARAFRVLALDKLGCGFTDNPPADDRYVMGSMVDHLLGFVRALGLRLVNLAGHSRGGYAVARLAVEHPDLVASLAIVDSNSLVSAPGSQYMAWEAEAAAISDIRERHRFLIRANSWSDAHITDRYLEVVSEVVSLPKTVDAKGKMDGGLRARFGRDFVERQAELQAMILAGRLSSPTLLVWGFEDPSATVDGSGIPAMRLVLGSVPTAEMHVLNHAGHMSMRERPEAFNTILADFIGRHGGIG